ncbi:MAG TPA: LPS assembly lipoprotein LptE [Methylomirabilota bacterium]|nr:LPS assembly lipoprotein LptE [Methylomirabilota bacterium]
MGKSLLLLGATLWLTGCAGYKLGPSNGLEAGAQSIQINPVVNKTFEPRIAEELNHQLRKQIQRDGTYKLRTRGEGDVVVTATISTYQRFGEAFQPRDTLTVRDYRIQLVAFVTAYDRISGKNLVNREFIGRTSVRIGSDQASSERQALPLLTEDLARSITSAITDGDW